MTLLGKWWRWLFEDQFATASRIRESSCPGGQHAWSSHGYGYGYSTYECTNADCGASFIIDLDLAEVR